MAYDVAEHASTFIPNQHHAPMCFLAELIAYIVIAEAAVIWVILTRIAENLRATGTAPPAR